MKESLLFRAWIKLLTAYILAFGISLLIGSLLVNIVNVEPDVIIDISTKRISYANPVLELGSRTGIDLGVMLFIWNSLACLATLSFIYTASWFNPSHVENFPRIVRRFFCSKTKMKLLCHLPGCSKIDSEPLRRLYLWLLVPYFGIVLLATENGLAISTAESILGSLSIGIISLLPHGIIEIPAICLAGAVAYAAHLKIRETGLKNHVADTFQTIESYRRILPMRKIVAVVIAAIFIAGVIEAHVTLKIIEKLTG